jgi:hypothetical protein
MHVCLYLWCWIGECDDHGNGGIDSNSSVSEPPISTSIQFFQHRTRILSGPPTSETLFFIFEIWAYLDLVCTSSVQLVWHFKSLCINSFVFHQFIYDVCSDFSLISGTADRQLMRRLCLFEKLHVCALTCSCSAIWDILVVMQLLGYCLVRHY